MKPISASTAAAQRDLETCNPLFEKELRGYTFMLCATQNGLLVKVLWPKGSGMAFRPVYTPAGPMELLSISEDDEKNSIVNVKDATGTYTSKISIIEDDYLYLKYETVYTPAFDVHIPHSPRDIMPVTKSGSLQNTSGEIHVHQVGTCSGLLFMSMQKPATGSVFYFQNLTSLNDYCNATETSAAELVGGQWPETGFRLPHSTDKPLPGGEKFKISDASIILSENIPGDDFEITQQFIDYLAAIYLKLPRPQTKYYPWPEIVHKGLEGLINHKGCWKFVGGRSYLNAYVSDYDNPPEIMVQLAVLMPLIDYDLWSGEDHSYLINTLKDGLPAFYDEQLNTIVRWHPKWQDKLDGAEEQKKPELMDSWYLHHPLMNLSRLALNGDEQAKKLVLESVGYAIKVAKHFNYEWPVFYKMSTLEVIKAETKEGEGGEKDVPGAYAHLMIQIWQLTGDRYYLNEAVRAAKKLKGLGFSIFYQANNTAFSAGAMLRLYKETKDETFLNLSYACIAAILKNVQLWDCGYGYAAHYPTFFSVYPLNDAPYTAAYEEQEVFAGLHNYLKEAEGIDIMPSVRLLVAEMIKFLINRMPFYYPPMLPQEVLSGEVKTGEIDPNLWIALEDLQDGWNKSGQVGQEVYGAGIAFGVLPRQYHKIKNENFMVYTDYPVRKITSYKKSATITLNGDPRLECCLILIAREDAKLPDFSVTMLSGKNGVALRGIESDGAKQKSISFAVTGNSTVKIKW
ncbi:hypothetical protein KJK34_11905 [Flavobacterium sp. D11R37]|uniref:hypothetical protein n=1 Tax=Flavobacterium coralii TaxID=2838017 RepID=UPI001CA6ECF6|nr:hypothetical protein [Flavobacterium coralii]MBY8963459.1 hypothetical protein [Flavobacterium coralii]